MVGPVYAQETNTEAKKRVYEASTFLVTTVVLLMALLMLWGGNVIVPKFVGNEYLASVKILKLLATSIFFVAATGNNGLLLQMGGRENIELQMSLVTFGLNVILNFWLIPTLGGWGAAVATAVSLFVSTALKTIICHREWNTLPTLFSRFRHFAGAICFYFCFSAVQLVPGIPDYLSLMAGSVAYIFTLSPRELRNAVSVVMAQGKVI